ncbi:metallophosphoesterase family protein [Actinomyces oris]|uniref:metallophosphoesterase family protein n=1 Tax=Actinomyces oris TaxID=544580 RepID=UPI00094C0E64|nr:exonuclease subunit SbcD [Actinomyces oris]OLO78276.1 exonuclease SbcCD subunit D [Actinomyces oris]
MRILHTSDWHLGRTFHGRVLDDAHAAFADHLVELVATESVDAVLVAGDVYDRAIPPNDAVALLDETLRRLTERTRVVLTPGNHDSARRLGFAADLMREGLIIRARTAGLDRGIILPDADGNEAAIVHALPYLDPDAAREILPPLLAERLGEETPAKHPAEEDQAESGDTSSQPGPPVRPRLPRSHEAVVSAALRLVAADLDRLRSARSRRLPSLLMAHAFVVGGEACESERDIRVGGVDSVPSGVFTTLGGSPLAERSGGVDYVALGHLHRPQELTRPAGPRLVYSGSPLPFSFDEAEGARNSATKSSVLLDLDADGVTGLERIPTPVLHQVRTLTGTMPELLSPAFDDATGAWVRVILQGERPPGALATLKERFGSLLAFQHEAPTRTARERIAVTAAADPLRITEDFFDDVCGRAPEPSERGVLRSAYESALASARNER